MINEFSLFKRKQNKSKTEEVPQQKRNNEELKKLEKEFSPISKKIFTKLTSAARSFINNNKTKIPGINAITVNNSLDTDWGGFYITICDIDLWKAAPDGNARDWYGSEDELKLENFFYKTLANKIKEEFNKMKLDIKATISADGDWDTGLITVDVDIDDFEKRNSNIFDECKFI